MSTKSRATAQSTISSQSLRCVQPLHCFALAALVNVIELLADTATNETRCCIWEYVLCCICIKNIEIKVCQTLCTAINLA